MHLRLSLLALLLILLLLPFAVPAGAAAPPRVWNWRNPVPQGLKLEAVAHGSGLWVAVGNHALLTSPDTVRWTLNQSGQTAALHAVLYANGAYVAVGTGVILTSADGGAWVRRDGPTAGDELLSLAYGNGRFVAAGRGVAMVSTDGANWRRYLLPFAGKPNGMVWANGLFVVVGEEGTILTSADGTRWVQQTSPTTETLSAVTFWNGRYVAAGANDTVLTSADGLAWQRVPITVPATDGHNDMIALVPFKGRLVALNTSMVTATWVLSTADGVTWQSDSSARWPLAFGLATDGDLLISVGQLGTILTSADGVAWSTRLGGINSIFESVAYGGGRFVAVGRSMEYAGGIYSSDDGSTWVARAGGGSLPESVTYGGGRFVALAYGTFYTSADGITWSTIPFDPKQAWLQAVTYGGGQFVAVGAEGRVLLSTDGLAWEIVSTAMTGIPRTITYGDGVYVAAGQEGVLYTSPDGRVWTAQASNTKANFYASAYGNGRFVLGGYDQVLLTSTDGGKTWSRSSGPKLMGLTFADGQFVGSGDGIQTSPDGLTWQADPGTADSYLLGVAYGGGQYVAVGSDGTILATGGRPTPTTYALPDTIPDPSRSTVEADRNFLPPYSQTPVTITVTLRDAAGRPVGGRLVQVDQAHAKDGPIPTVRPSRGAITDAGGKATFTIYGAGPGMAIMRATDLTDNVRLGTELPMLFTPCAGLFADVGKSANGCRAVEELAARKIIGGFPDGTFQPDRGLTRAELAKILVTTMKAVPLPGTEASFTDTRGHWGATQGYIQAAVRLNAMTGFPDGSFRPDAPVTRAMLVKATMAATGFPPSDSYFALYKDVLATDWYKPWVTGAWKGILIGNAGPWPVFLPPDFRGDQPATRMEAALFVANAMVRKGWIDP